jgi:hypothetical protein
MFKFSFLFYFFVFKKKIKLSFASFLSFLSIPSLLCLDEELEIGYPEIHSCYSNCNNSSYLISFSIMFVMFLSFSSPPIAIVGLLEKKYRIPKKTDIYTKTIEGIEFSSNLLELQGLQFFGSRPFYVTYNIVGF